MEFAKVLACFENEAAGPNLFEPPLECGQYLDFVSGSLHIVYKASLNHGGYPHSLHDFHNMVHDQYAQEKTGKRYS